MTTAQPERLLPVGHGLGPVFGDHAPSQAPRVVQVGGRQEVLTDAEDRVWRAARPDPADRLPGDAGTLHLRVVAGGDDPQLVPHLESRGLLLRLPGTGVAPAAVLGHRARPVGVGLARPGADGTDDLGLPGMPLVSLSPDESWLWQLAVAAPDLVTAARLDVLHRVVGEGGPADHEATEPELVEALDRSVAVLARLLAAGCGRLDVADQPW